MARFLTALLRHYQHGAPLTTRAEALLTHALECGRAPASRDDLQFIATLPLMDADAPTPLWPQIAERAARSGRRSNFLACGTAWHACLVTEHLVERFARVPVEVDYASEFRYRNMPLGNSTLPRVGPRELKRMPM